MTITLPGISAFTCAEVGDNTVTLTVTDNNGNTNTCPAIVTVEDNIAPVPDVDPLLDVTGECSVLALVPPTGSDNSKFYILLYGCKIQPEFKFGPNSEKSKMAASDPT